MPSHIYDLQDTWNAGGVVFNGIKIDVNNAASANGSRLLRVDTAGASQFAVDPVGGAIVGAATGGPMGPGTVNATGYYVNGVLAGGVTNGDKGDITVSDAGLTWTIDPQAVTYAKIQNVSATARVLGRFSGGAGPIEEGTGAQVNVLLPLFTDVLKGLVPPSGGGNTLFLRADQTWATPTGGGGGSGLTDAYQIITDGVTPASAVGAATFKLRAAAPLNVITENVNATHGKNALFNFVAGTFGDIVISAGAWTIADNSVSFAKMQDMPAQSTLLGRGQGAGAGDPQPIILGTNLTMSGTTLNATGGGAGGFTSSATAPPTPVAGDRWYNTDTGVESTYVNDGNSSQWVQTAPTVSPPAANGFAGVNVQTFAASGTYTPTVGMKYCQIECVGGGGGGGGTGDFTAYYGGGAGGGSGGYSRKTVNAAVIGASQAVTIGAGGTAGAAAGITVAGAGGVTSVGTICIANGGAGGPGYGVSPGTGAGGAGATAGTGDVAVAGNPGGSSGSSNFGADGAVTFAGHGGASFFGGAGRCGAPNAGASAVGSPGSMGGGAGGGSSANSATTRAGGIGGAGFVIITEYF